MSCIWVPHSCLCSLWIHSCTSLAFLQLEMLNISSHVLWHNCSIRSRWVCLAMPEFLFLFVLGSLPSWQVKGRAPTWPCAVWWWPSASCSCSSSWRVSLSVPSSRTWNTCAREGWKNLTKSPLTRWTACLLVDTPADGPALVIITQMRCAC